MRTSFITPSKVFFSKPTPFEDAYFRRCLRVIRMVCVLHGKGFQGLRIFPYNYPLSYRIEIYPSAYTDLDGVKHRFRPELERSDLLALYTGSAGNEFFGWPDAADASAHDLALLFIKRFPKLVHAAYHLDFAYAGWLATLLSHCEYGHVPFLFGEYEEDLGVLRMNHVGGLETEYQMDWFPLPPTPSGGFSLDPRPRPPWMGAQ